MGTSAAFFASPPIRSSLPRLLADRYGVIIHGSGLILKVYSVQNTSEGLGIGQVKDNEKGFISRSVIPSG